MPHRWLAFSVVRTRGQGRLVLCAAGFAHGFYPTPTGLKSCDPAPQPLPCRLPRRPGSAYWGLRAMSPPTSPPELLAERRRVLAGVVGRTLLPPAGTPGPSLPGERLEHLVGELESLYWNDLEWENVTEEERMEGGALPELTFPGVLALTRGLLLTEVAADALAAAEPRPEVVDAFLHFLAGRILSLREAAGGAPSEEADRAALELRMTEGLLDRVLVEYHGLEPEDVGTLEDV